MQVATFLIVGFVSFLLLLLLGYRLIHNSGITARRFALIMTPLSALVVFIVGIVSRPIDRGLVFVAIFIFIISLAVGYPIFYYFHRYLSKNKNNNR